MATLNPVSKSRVKDCERCGGPITFIQNRVGKWYPVDVFKHCGGFAYRSRIGNHKNLTLWHRCELIQHERRTDSERERDKSKAIIEEVNKVWDRLSPDQKEVLAAMRNQEIANLEKWIAYHPAHPDVENVRGWVELIRKEAK